MRIFYTKPGEVSTRSSSPPTIGGGDSANLATYSSTSSSTANYSDYEKLRGSAANLNAEGDESDSEVTQEDELLLEGIIGGAAGVGDTDINMSSGPDGLAAAPGPVVG